MNISIKLYRALKLALLTLITATALVFAAPSEAEAGHTGFEFQGGFGYLISAGNSYTHHGINFTFSPGYRWDWIGVYIDQTLGGVFPHKRSYFIGSTIVNAKAFYNITAPLEIWGQVGIGAAYVEDYGLFGLKLGVGMSYAIRSNIAIGGDFTYTLGANDGTMHFICFSGHIRFMF